MNTVGWTLVSRELLAHAARSRTYVLRTLIAAFGITLLASIVGLERLLGIGGAAGIMGLGDQVFAVITTVGIAVTAILTPIIMLNYLPQERENGNLDLLLVSPISRIFLIVAGVSGSLLGILSLLLVLAPLAAIAYSLGGISLNQMGNVLVTVVAIGLSFGSVACWAGSDRLNQRQAWARFVSTILLYFHVVLPLAVAIICLVVRKSGLTEDWPTIHGSPYGAQIAADRSPLLNAIGLMPVWLLSWWFIRLAATSINGHSVSFIDAPSPRLRTYISRKNLENRERSKLFQWFRPPSNLPHNRPIAWLESIQSAGRGTALAHPRTQTIILSVLSLIPLISTLNSLNSDSFSSWIWCLGWLGWIQVMMGGASSVPAAQSTATHDLLAILPRSSTSILRERHSVVGARYAPWYCLIITANCFTALLFSYVWDGDRNQIILDSAAACVLIICSTWPSMTIASTATSRIQANIHACTALVAWAAIPCIAHSLLKPFVVPDAWWLQNIALSSPVHLLTPSLMSPDNTGTRTLTSMFIFICIALISRWFCLARADRILGRAC